MISTGKRWPLYNDDGVASTNAGWSLTERPNTPSPVNLTMPSWARRSRLPEFVKLAKTITRYLPLIHNTLDTGLGNARSEATNTHLRLLTRRSYGFHSAAALIAMANLTRGGLCPPLPGRS